MSTRSQTASAFKVIEEALLRYEVALASLKTASELVDNLKRASTAQHILNIRTAARDNGSEGNETAWEAAVLATIGNLSACTTQAMEAGKSYIENIGGTIQGTLQRAADALKPEQEGKP
jgi:hypothetical protein